MTKHLLKFTGLLFTLCIHALTLSAQGGQPPSNVALFFAVNDYEYLDDLSNPIKNARAIASVLEERYGFEVQVVENPSMDRIDEVLERYANRFLKNELDQRGQLFLFFSGHGVFDQKQGYFMAADSDPDRPHRSALEYDYYRSKINSIPCQHILVAIDACHSASFDPAFGSRTDRRFARKGEAQVDKVIENHKQYTTRCFWTSDGSGNETPDRSNFAYEMLNGLRNAAPAVGYVRSSVLFSNYLEKATPQPGGGSFGSDEPGGCFIFFQDAELEGPKSVVGDGETVQSGLADFLAPKTSAVQNIVLAYNQALALDTDAFLSFDPVFPPADEINKALFWVAPNSQAELQYQLVLSEIDNALKKSSRLSKKKQLGSLLYMKALCHHRLNNAPEALVAAQQARREMAAEGSLQLAGESVLQMLEVNYQMRAAIDSFEAMDRKYSEDREYLKEIEFGKDKEEERNNYCVVLKSMYLQNIHSQGNEKARLEEALFNLAAVKDKTKSDSDFYIQLLKLQSEALKIWAYQWERISVIDQIYCGNQAIESWLKEEEANIFKAYSDEFFDDLKKVMKRELSEEERKQWRWIYKPLWFAKD